MDVEEKAINDITPPELAGASVYANLQEKVISFPAIGPGATIDLRIQRLTRAPEDPENRHFWGIVFFQRTAPILHREFTLRVPKGVIPNYLVERSELRPEIIDSDTATSYTWRVKDMEQIIPEQNMPPLASIAPRLLYSSEGSWKEIASWFGRTFYDKLEVGDMLSSKVAELVSEKETIPDKVREIALYVISQVRNVRLSLGEAGYEPNNSSEVFENRYGEWRDKAVLLVSMLRSAGIESYPAMVNGDKVGLVEEIPTPKQFDRLYVFVPGGGAGGEDLWINPMGDIYLYGYFPLAQGSRSLVIKEKDYELMDVMNVPPEKNLCEVDLDVALSENGDVEGTVTCQLDGHFDMRARAYLKYATPRERKQFFDGAANSIGEGTIELEHSLSELDDLTEPVRVSQSFRSPELGVVEGDMMVLRLPPVPFSFTNFPYYPSLSERKFDFLPDTDFVIRIRGVLNIPEGHDVAYMPPGSDIIGEFGSWEVRFRLSDDASKIFYTKEMRLEEDPICPVSYAEYKDFFDDFVSPRNRLILLER
jgi:hypothetical protein